MRAAEPDGEHQGPYGAAHSSESVCGWKLRPGDTITEVTSGIGISFARLARAGHRSTSSCRLDESGTQGSDSKLRSYGGSSQQGAGGFLAVFAWRGNGCQARRCISSVQFSNEANTEATRRRLGRRLGAIGESRIAARRFRCGSRHGGTVMGVARFLRSRNSKIRVHPVEPAESPTLSTGHKVANTASRDIGRIHSRAPRSLDARQSHRVSDGDSIIMAQKLTSTLGLAVGISSGCNSWPL